MTPFKGQKSERTSLNRAFSCLLIFLVKLLKVTLPSNVNYQLSIVNWSAGIYFYEVRGLEGSSRGKFVKVN
jgi:hypothetical protein